MDTHLTVKRCKSDYAETVKRLGKAIERRGLRLFALIDHAAAAREVGLELGNEQVFIFGDPRGGTPLMQEDPRVGIELPLRMLVWEDDQGTTLAYHDPREFAVSYEVREHRPILEAMANMLHSLADEASS
ncbi:MAG: DUF302 domain-containing protein [Solirubrobacteraceae bacterium]